MPCHRPGSPSNSRRPAVIRPAIDEPNRKAHAQLQREEIGDSAPRAGVFAYAFVIALTNLVAVPLITRREAVPTQPLQLHEEVQATSAGW
jgi:hypothetical protein